jgi:hypothetical protein
MHPLLLFDGIVVELGGESGWQSFEGQWRLSPFDGSSYGLRK